MEGEELSEDRDGTKGKENGKQTESLETSCHFPLTGIRSERKGDKIDFESTFNI